MNEKSHLDSLKPSQRYNCVRLYNRSCKILLLCFSACSYLVFCLMFLRQPQSVFTCAVFVSLHHSHLVCPLVLLVSLLKYDRHIVQYYKGVKCFFVVFPAMFGLSCVEPGISLGILRSRTLFCVVHSSLMFASQLRYRSCKIPLNSFSLFGLEIIYFFQHHVCALI